MSTKIQNLLDHALGDGARAAKFEVQVIMPSATSFTDDQAMSTVAKAASFPGKAHEMIALKHKGRAIPVRGQTRYTQSWDVTFYMHENHAIKRSIEEWIEAIDQKHNYDTPDAFYASALQSEFAGGTYVRPIVIHQKNFNMNASPAVYTLYNCMPVAVGPVEVSAETTGSVLEFTVTFAYTHFIINKASGVKSIGNYGSIEDFVNSLASDAIGSAQITLDNLVNNIVSPVQSFVDATINDVTSEISGAVSGAVDNLYQSLF